MNSPTAIRRSILLITITLLLFAAFRFTFLDGVLRRVTIDGPSMAPAFCGAHYSVTCDDCGFSFPCDAEHLPTDSRAVCPNCGYTENVLKDADFRPAEQVLIDRWPLLGASPRSVDVIAAALPGSPDIAVKRIAGLPNERVSIIRGDLFANENIVRKTVAELHQVHVLVHDNDYQPQKTRDLPQRWRPAETQSHWKMRSGGFHCDQKSADQTNYDWLQYEHWKCTADAKTRGIAAPITDNDSYNQGETRRPLNIVDDVLLSCRLRSTGSGKFAVAAIAGDQRFEVEIEPNQKAILRASGQELAAKRLNASFSRRFVRIEFGLCDHQLLFVVDGHIVFRHSYQPSANSITEPLNALAIGAQNTHVELTSLRVWRDLYYLDPQGLSRPWQSAKALGNDEYAVLGDNQPVSIDSRHWEPLGLPGSSLRGRVYRPFWGSHRLD